jgi:hypothetical protein
MSKRPPFDPEVLARNKPSQSLKPLDFLKPMVEEEPAPSDPPSAPPSVPEPDASPAPKAALQSAYANPAPAQPAPPDDPRYSPAPVGDDTVLKSFRIAKHTNAQLKAERYWNGLDEQDVINEAIAEWFEKRYGSKGSK